MPVAAAIAPAVSALKALMASKYFWHLLIGGGLLGKETLTQLGKAGERGIAREQIALQQFLGEGQIGATKRATEESRKRAKEYTEMLLKTRREEKGEAREQDLMQMFLASQDRRMAMLMQAIQGLSQTRPRYSASPGGGMLGLMRSNL